MLADIAALDRHILALDPTGIAEARSRLTVVGGEIAYSDGTLD